MTELTEMEIDELVTAEADDTEAWESAISVKGLAQQLDLPLPLAQRAALLANLHQTNMTEWLLAIIQERVQFEEKAYRMLKETIVS